MFVEIVRDVIYVDYFGFFFFVCFFCGCSGCVCSFFCVFGDFVDVCVGFVCGCDSGDIFGFGIKFFDYG